MSLSAAFLPSMKPAGIALGARIWYLVKNIVDNICSIVLVHWKVYVQETRNHSGAVLCGTLLTRMQWKEICPLHGFAEPLYYSGGRLYKYTFRVKVF